MQGETKHKMKLQKLWDLDKQNQTLHELKYPVKLLNKKLTNTKIMQINLNPNTCGISLNCWNNSERCMQNNAIFTSRLFAHHGKSGNTLKIS